MNKEKIRKVLIIISIIIMGFGIVLGISISNQLVDSSGVHNSTFIIDGSDFSGFAQMFVGIGTTIIGFMVAFYFIAIVIVIWIVYGISILVIKVTNKIKEKRNEDC